MQRTDGLHGVAEPDSGFGFSLDDDLSQTGNAFPSGLDQSTLPQLDLDSFFADAFYPSPDPVQPTPYPEATLLSPRAFPPRVNVESAVQRIRAVTRIPEQPSDAIVVSEQRWHDVPLAHSRVDSAVGIPIDTSTPYNIQHARPVEFIQPPSSTQLPDRTVPHALRDRAGPYVPGDIERQSEIDRVVENAEIIVRQISIDPSTLICVHCGKPFADSSGLRHHAITHDKTKTQRHKCEACLQGFRYPKDLQRHIRDRHGEGDIKRYACAHCSKAYKRKDHLRRHQKRSGHAATQDDGWGLSPSSAATSRRQSVVSLSPSAPSSAAMSRRPSVISQATSSSYQTALSQYAVPANQLPQYPRQQAESGPGFQELSQQLSLLVPPFERSPRSSFGSSHTDLQDEISPISDIDSFGAPGF